MHCLVKTTIEDMNHEHQILEEVFLYAQARLIAIFVAIYYSQSVQSVYRAYRYAHSFVIFCRLSSPPADDDKRRTSNQVPRLVLIAKI